MQIVALEGIVGCGKTSQLQRLEKYLSPNVYVIPELNTHPIMIEAIGRWRIKRSQLGRYYFDEEDITQLAIARAQSQKEYLEKARNSPWILTDRSVYTAIVFEQGKVPPSKIEEINRSRGVIFPDICIILDCEIEKALRRIDQRRIQTNKYKHRAPHESTERLLQTRELYRELAKKSNFSVIDTNNTEDIVFSKILEALQI